MFRRSNVKVLTARDTKKQEESGLRRGIGSVVGVLFSVSLAAWAIAPPRLGQAIKAQQELVAQHPLDAGAHNDLGNLLVLAGDLAAAEDAYRRSLELDSDRAATRFNLALLLQQLGQGEEASQLYHQVLESEPNHAWAHYQIGALREDDGNRKGAIDAYARALSLNPELAFPDVNPHAIENTLLTEAMLRGYRGYLGEAIAPRSYDNASRVTSLLLEPAPPSASEGGEEANEDSRDSIRSSGGTARESASPGETETEEESPGQQGQTGSQSRSQVLSRRTLAPGTGSGQVVRQPSRGLPSGQPSSSAGTGGSRTVPVPSRRGGAGTTPSRGFEPRSESTGRLDLELLPSRMPGGPALAIIAG
jgi:DNA-binding SARP family transcriptional activator